MKPYTAPEDTPGFYMAQIDSSGNHTQSYE